MTMINPDIEIWTEIVEQEDFNPVCQSIKVISNTRVILEECGQKADWFRITKCPSCQHYTENFICETHRTAFPKTTCQKCLFRAPTINFIVSLQKL